MALIAGEIVVLVVRAACRLDFLLIILNAASCHFVVPPRDRPMVCLHGVLEALRVWGVGLF